MMKKISILAKATILVTIALFVCTIDDFLSLHDIYKDYVSKQALQYLGVETSKPLPDWTNTELEWFSITISYTVRFSLVIVSLCLLLMLKRTIAKMRMQQPGSL